MGRFIYQNVKNKITKKRNFHKKFGFYDLLLKKSYSRKNVFFRSNQKKCLFFKIKLVMPSFHKKIVFLILKRRVAGKNIEKFFFFFFLI